MDEQRQQRIKKITQSIIGLPTLPTVITQMIGLIDNPKTSAKDVADLISTDQALTAKILKLANSAFYGFPREIATVNHAAKDVLEETQDAEDTSGIFGSQWAMWGGSGGAVESNAGRPRITSGEAYTSMLPVTYIGVNA